MNTTKLPVPNLTKTAIDMLRGMAFQLADRHGDDLPGVETLNDIAQDLNDGFTSLAHNELETLSMGLGINNGSPEWRGCVRDTARVALTLLNGCDW